MPKTALIAGSTGLIGRQLLDLLVHSDDYERVVVLSRRELEYKSPKIQVEVVAFDSLDHTAEYWKVDDVFCCLGTTMKKAGSKEAFKKVDFSYPLKIAQITKSKGAQTYHLVSAIGADKRSGIFYNKVKGEIEAAITELGFDQYHIYQPSLLLGKRDEFRLGERIGIFFFKILGILMLGPLKKYRGIESQKVAKAMYTFATEERKGTFIHQSDELQSF